MFHLKGLLIFILRQNKLKGRNILWARLYFNNDVMNSFFFFYNIRPFKGGKKKKFF